MNVMKRITKKRLIGFLICMILPILAMVIRGIKLTPDIVLNKSFAIAYITIPLSTVCLCALVIFSSKRLHIKYNLLTLIMILFLVSFFVASIFGTFEYLTYSKNEDIGSTYTEVCENFEAMPSRDTIGEYLQMEHYDYYSYAFIFEWDSDILIVKYNEQEYQKQKALLEEKYAFQTEPLSAHDYSCEPNVQIGDYSFRALAVKGKYSDLRYPLRLVFIATNDKEKKISYTAFHDKDLDYIESLEDFLWNDAGWKYVN